MILDPRIRIFTQNPQAKNQPSRLKLKNQTQGSRTRLQLKVQADSKSLKSKLNFKGQARGSKDIIFPLFLEKWGEPIRE